MSVSEMIEKTVRNELDDIRVQLVDIVDMCATGDYTAEEIGQHLEAVVSKI